VIERYRQLWAPDSETLPGALLVWGLLAASIIIPLLLGILVYDPIISLIGLGIIVLFIGIILFFNVTHFAIFVFPLIFIITYHHVILGISILFAISFLAGRLQAGHISIQLAYPIMILVLILSGTIGLTRAYDQDMGRYLFQYNLLLPILVFLVYYNLKPSNKSIVVNLTVICIFAAIIGWISIGRYLSSGWTRAIIGWRTNPAACFFGMILPFALLSLLYAENNLKKILWWVTLLGIFAGIFVTQSRGIYLTTLLTLLYIYWKDPRVLKVIMPIVVLALFIVPTLILYRLAILFGVGQEVDWSSVGRIQIWVNSIILLPKYYLLGMGIDSFRYVYPINFPMAIVRAEHPHNIYLRWLFEYGMAGVFAYIYILWGVLRRTIKRIILIEKGNWTEDDRLLFGINAGFITSLLFSFVDSPFHHPQVVILLWMYIAFQLILVGRANA